MKKKKQMVKLLEFKGPYATQAAQLLIEIDHIIRTRVKVCKNKKVAHHLISAGLGVQDALTDLKKDFLKRERLVKE